MILGRLKRFNAADWITTARIVAIPFILATTLLEWKLTTAWIVSIALFTDVVDGYVARHFKIASPFGAKLDSVADASLFITAFLSFVWFFPDFVQQHVRQISLLMGLYVFQLVFSLIKYKHVTSFHTYAAKLAAIAEGIFLMVCLFYEPVIWLFYITWIVGLLEQAEEITLMFLLPQLRENVKGVYWVLKERGKA